MFSRPLSGSGPPNTTPKPFEFLSPFRPGAPGAPRAPFWCKRGGNPLIFINLMEFHQNALKCMELYILMYFTPKHLKITRFTPLGVEIRLPCRGSRGGPRGSLGGPRGSLGDPRGSLGGEHRDPLCRDPLCRDPLHRHPLCRFSISPLGPHKQFAFLRSTIIYKCIFCL